MQINDGHGSMMSMPFEHMGGHMGFFALLVGVTLLIAGFGAGNLVGRKR